MSTDLPVEGPADYLESTPRERRSRRLAWTVGGAVVAVGLTAVGGFGLAQFLAAGPAPATAVPANAIAYFALDLDPSGGQKVEALQTLRKFPSLKAQLDTSSDDLRRWVFDALEIGQQCPDVDFDSDVAGWLGKKLAVAAVSPAQAGEWPVPFGVVQVTDQGKARAGLEEWGACLGDGDAADHPGVAFVDDFAIIGQDQADVDRIAADARAGSLADAAAYDSLVGAAGGEGIVTGYVAADAPPVDRRCLPARADELRGRRGLRRLRATDSQRRRPAASRAGPRDRAAGRVAFRVPERVAAHGLPERLPERLPDRLPDRPADRLPDRPAD